jgi:phosphoglycerate-specific signal transduction histidine kinase
MQLPQFISKIYSKFVENGLQLFLRLSKNHSKEFGGKETDTKRLENLSILGAISVSIEHDLRNPLATINNIVQDSKRKFSQNPELIKNLESIESATNRMKEICSFLSHFRETINSDNSLEIDLVNSINKSIKNVKTILNNERNIYLNVENESVLVLGIPSLLEKAFTDIFITLLKDKEVKKITVRVFLDTSKGNIVVEIICNTRKDNSPKHKPFSMRKYREIWNELILVRRIVEIHKGTMDIDVEGDEMESITLSLPRHIIKKMRNLNNEKENTSY